MKHSNYYAKSSINRRKNKSVVLARRYLPLFKKFFISVVTLSTLYFFYYAFYKSNFFRVSNIETVGTNMYVSDTDLKMVLHNKAIGQHILALNTNSLEKALEGYFLGAKKIAIQKKLFNTLICVVTERAPVALLEKQNVTDKYLIDEDGYVLGIKTSDIQDFPVINYEGDIFVGSYIDKNIIPLSFELINSSKELDLSISSISFKPKYSVGYVNNVEVILGTDKDIKESLKVVSKLLKNLGLEGKNIKKIDLRYDKVVVLYD